MRRQATAPTMLLAGLLAIGLAFLPACGSEQAAEPGAEEQAQEQTDQAAEEAEETEPAEEPAEAEPEVLSAWVVSGVTGTNAMGDEYSSAYTLDEHGNVTKIESSYGNVTTCEYDEFGNVTREVFDFGDGTTVTSTYEYVLDDAGRPVSCHAEDVSDDPEFPSTTTYDTTYEYYEDGGLKSEATDMVNVASYEGQEETYTSRRVYEYDEGGLQTGEFFEDEESSSETTFAWELDEAGNPVRVTRTTTEGEESYDLVSTFECDENGNVVSRTDEYRMTTYDENNKPTDHEVITMTQSSEYTYVEDCSRAAYDGAQLTGLQL